MLKRILFLFMLLSGTLLLVGCEEDKVYEEEVVGLEFKFKDDFLGGSTSIYIETNEGGFSESYSYVDFVKSEEDINKITYKKYTSGSVYGIKVYLRKDDLVKFSKDFAKETGSTLMIRRD